MSVVGIRLVEQHYGGIRLGVVSHGESDERKPPRQTNQVQACPRAISKQANDNPRAGMTAANIFVNGIEAETVR